MFKQIQVITISSKYTNGILVSMFTANLLADDLWNVWITVQISM